jgi:hypothetical protein
MIAKRSNTDVRRACRDREAIDEAMRQGAISAFMLHSWTNTPLVVWQDGRIEHVDPNDPAAPIPESFPAPRSQSPRWHSM